LFSGECLQSLEKYRSGVAAEFVMVMVIYHGSHATVPVLHTAYWGDALRAPPSSDLCASGDNPRDSGTGSVKLKVQNDVTKVHTC
jgi:hypothetical protein